MGGGTRSARCNEQAREIWDFCEERDIWMSVAHIPGEENVDADHESRQFTENTEWELSPEIFKMICCAIRHDNNNNMGGGVIFGARACLCQS